MDIYTYSVDLYGPAQAAPLPDITGFEVEAVDGHIGKVDEATYEPSSSCLVVDTGFWIFGKKRMIPAAAVQRIDPDAQQVFVNLTKDQVKSAPDHDEARHASDETGYHEEMGSYYRPHVGGGA
ncbi:MAG: PRC-barrel domain-containing protein [Acidimicrobiia bacterium]